ncbi:hypothetical protein GCM10028803_51070 [Larkinella knui]|uniref:DUF4199 domain-containing protein n=1 Tax=Larkinella knui TaxID=2025310 RepID=A0A3P1CH45_9BACT|nr:DUF4199 domain-containing protein [Larkinella knui]RRB12671.1 DUF4199 domain-containing protein [Larkinella knui]
MKKIVLVCGLIAGIILTCVMVVSTAVCYTNNNYEGNMVLGYASMILAFSLIFVGIKNFRDNYNNRIISFGKAFTIGLYITLIASSMYVFTWLIEYYVFIPDFMEKYIDHVLKEAKANGASQLELDKKLAELAGYTEMYKSPLGVIALTYLEILPVGLIISLICALLLKRNNQPIQTA